MKSSEYFDLLFSGIDSANVHTEIKNISDTWVFDCLISSGISSVRGAIKRELERSTQIEFETSAIDNLIYSLNNYLQKVLAPILQDNYKDFINKCEKANFIPCKRPVELERELRAKFLHAMRQHGSKRLFDNHAFLYQTALNVIENWRKNAIRLFHRLESDQKLIERQLVLQSKESAIAKNHSEPFRVRHLRLNLSDPHNGNQSVVIVELNSRHKLVYKPRPLDPEEAFYGWVGHLKKESTIFQDIYVPWVINRKTHGWMEHIQPLTQANKELDIDSVARQFGTLAVLWYIVGGTDLHNENLIFSQEGLILPDCETVFEADIFYQHLDKSTMTKPMLEPAATLHTLLSTDMLSALISDLNPTKEKLKQVGGITDIKKMLSIDQEKLGHTWSAFTETVCTSVNDTILYFQTQDNKQIVADIKHYYAGKTTTRMILRPTASYAALLDNLSRNHKATTSKTSVLRYIESQLGKAPGLHPTLPEVKFGHSETLQLINFDIPYFRRELGNNRITSETGLEQDIKNCDFQSLFWRLKFTRDESFISNQKYIVRLMLNPTPLLSSYTCTNYVAEESRYHHKNADSFLRLLSFARKDSRRMLSGLAKSMIQSAGTTANSLGNFYVEEFEGSRNMIQLLPTSYSLFEGLSGKLLFMGSLAKIMKRSKLAVMTDEQLKYFLKLGTEPPYIQDNCYGGIGGGYQSLLYVMEYLKRMMVFDGKLQESHLLAIKPKTANASSYDLVSSASGNSLLACVLADRLSDNIVDSWTGHLKKSMQQLIADWDKTKDRERIGLAHGALGPCLAASKLVITRGHDQELEDLVMKLIDMEAKASSEPNSVGQSQGWCYGATGRALAYYETGKAFNRNDLIEKALDLTETKDRKFSFINHTLCCGSLGFIAAHIYIRGEQENHSNKHLYLKKFFDFYSNPSALLQKSKRDDPHNMPYGLFYGLSGLGLVLLYCMEPEKVPPVWVFGLPTKTT